MKNIYIIIIISALTTAVRAQIVSIPDANFKNALVNTLCVDINNDLNGDVDVDTNNDGEIQLSEAEAVLSLIVNDQNISSLEGIQSFTNIESLRCQDNSLTNLDFTQNLNLEWLQCHTNSLTSLDVTQNISLITLWCYQNSFTSLDVTQNINLRRLYANDNSLTSLDVTQNHSLEELWLGNNQLTSLDVTQNPNLENFTCYLNSLTGLDVTQNPNLMYLECTLSSLTDLDVSQNPNLVSLFCSFNQLTSLDVSQNTNLKYLRCYGSPQLNSLNVKNGNNVNMTIMRADDSPNLTCIQIDDETATYPVCNGSSGWCKDAIALYSEDCVLGIDNAKDLEQIMIYPNPVSTIMHLNNYANVNITSMQIFNINGDLVLKVESNFEKVNVTNLNIGMYLVKVKTDKKIIVKKILVN